MSEVEVSPLYRRADAILKRAAKRKARIDAETQRELTKVYPVRVGQRYVNQWGGRYLVEKVAWDCITRQGPLVILLMEGLPSRAVVTRFYDEMQTEFRRIKGSRRTG